jgi:hypothetical protein
MRVMRLAELPHTASFLPLFLYVLADHRVEPPLAMVTLDNRYSPEYGNSAEFKANLVHFAGWVDPAALDASSPLVPMVPRPLFLTKFQLDIYHPSRIEDDFVFAFADDDTLFRAVEIRYEQGFGGLQVLLIGIVAILGLLLVLAYVLPGVAAKHNDG